jgi:hypothetical protein
MDNNGHTFTPKEGGIGMPAQKDCPYEPLSTGKMRRGKNPKVFDNNGGNSKADGAGTKETNDMYSSVTYGF